MIMLSKFSNFPNELSKNDELREYELRGSDCSSTHRTAHKSNPVSGGPNASDRSTAH